MEFTRSATDPASLQRYVELMAACFPGVTKFSLDYLRWLYADNPDGAVVGFDAFEGDRLAAHYACIPATARIEGAPARVLLSLNTATHPQFQGKGLFTQLAEKTYAAGLEQGMDAVYGVANANSTPGFVRKLGFQLVTPLEARVGVGSLLRAGAGAADSLSFKRTRSPESLSWRCASPHNAVGLRRTDGVAQCFARAAPALSAYHEFNAAEVDGVPVSGAPAALRLFLGLVPRRAISTAYIRIPDRLRPSPLNLIYKPLASTVHRIDPDHVSFAFIDFDAY